MELILPRPLFLIIWLAATVMISGYMSWVFFGKEDKTSLLPGVTTSGHHQIEQRCDVCHDNETTKGLFTSSGVSNAACNSCHAADLELANDSHPVAKFRNPENAVLLKHIDAMQCVTCHTEHLEDHTHEMAVSIPPDYCAHCHTSTLESRESHKGLPFNTCATAGCHNYHDNTALFESFLLEHAGEPNTLSTASAPLSPAVYRWIAKAGDPSPAISPDAPAEVLTSHSGHVEDLVQTSHANAGVNCSACHGGGASGHKWQVRPAADSCASCHDIEAKDFHKGKHGMRVAAELSPMKPSMARLAMKPDIAHTQLDCVSCHEAHEFDRKLAAAEACLNCHNDEHSQNYQNSSHFALWKAEISEQSPVGSGVSCATCHMPKETRRDESTGETISVVQHNQNSNLRPNEKMYREVCMNCHGLEFTMNALADRDSIHSNFATHPETVIESIKWSVDGEKMREERRLKIQEKQDTTKQKRPE